MKTGAFIIPTGIGASIGGYAGDASLYARKISKKAKLIVNPNVVNAACFSGINENMLYVEGYALNQFFKGNLELSEATSNKIGIVFDKSISKKVLNVHLNTVNAVKTVYGINILDYEITNSPVGVNFHINKSGISMGDVQNLKTIKEAAIKLINKGCNAIAIVCSFPEDTTDDYANGIGVDPVGGVEAIISHYLTKELSIPCAHAPAFEDLTISTKIVDKRCAAEYITPTFLPCVLMGLNNAPVLTNNGNISVDNIDFIVTPYDSMGSIPVLEANKKGIQIYSIKENKTVLDVTGLNLNIKCDIINTYDELLELL